VARSPSHDSTSATLDLSDRSVFTQSHVSPGEASLICRRALAQLQVDTAVVSVVSCAKGCIKGRMQHDSELLDVVFAILQIKPGYCVVANVVEGPPIFTKVCWKLKSVNGCCDINAACISRGDLVVLEGPRWATERLRQSKGKSPEEGLLAEAEEREEVSEEQMEPEEVQQATKVQLEHLEQVEVMSLSRTNRPQVPRLDLAGVKGDVNCNAQCQQGQCRAAALQSKCEPLEPLQCLVM